MKCLAKKILANQFLKKLNKITVGKITLHDKTSGQHYVFGDSTDQSLIAHVEVLDQRFYTKTIFSGSIGAGESYMRGDWTCDNLTALFCIIIQNQSVLTSLEAGLALFARTLNTIKNIFTFNHVNRARENILKHYDLSNQFFGLFLDKKMIYSSAVFSDHISHHKNYDLALEQAQEYKLKIICDALKLKPSDHLLEIGTGWGALAIYAAQNYGCQVTTTTISDQQYDYTREKIIALKLEHKITLLKQDYRKLSGHYDKLVSVEMIESIGFHYFSKFFAVCNQLLKPNGLFFLQAITISDQQYNRYRRERDFINTYIFPNGCLPSLYKMTQCIKNHTTMRILHINDISQSYSITLAIWRQRFLNNLSAIKQLGFDDVLINMFCFYFCYCEAGFLTEYISDLHILLKKLSV